MGAGATRASPRRLMGPSSPHYLGYGWINCRLFRAHQRRPRGFAGVAHGPAGFPSATRVRSEGCIGRRRFAMIPPRWPVILRRPRPLAISGGGRRIRARPTRRIRALPTDFAGPTPTHHRIAKESAPRDIVTDKYPPSRQFRRAICVHISELHPRWLKMWRRIPPYPRPRIKPAAARWAKNVQNTL